MDNVGLFDDQNAYWILGLNTLLHELGVPVPMTPTALVAGARAVTAAVDPIALVLVIVIGMVMGNSVWFYAGRRYGSAVLKLLCRVSLSPDTCVARTEGSFGKWGGSALVIGRFLPGVTLVAPPLAGALGMSWTRFLALTVTGAALFGAVVVGAGMLLHQHIEALLSMLTTFGWEAVALLVVLLLMYVAWRWWRRRAALALGIPRIKVDELRTLLAAGEPVELIDVRGRNAQQLDQRRIPGATVMHLDEIESGRFTAPHDRQIVIYCSCPNEVSAAKAAQLLHQRGYLRARPLLGGLEAWMAS
ncbi:MAG: DedA family protein/thiosulfate sulfurtransferase GlpE, partial [Burkholderiaceae bacterium]